MEIKYKEVQSVKPNALLDLYTDAKWTAYTDDIKKLERAVQNSLFVLIATHNEKLVGLIRVIGDAETILYIQDILVHSAYKRNKIGTELLRRTVAKFEEVRQKVLLTEDSKETRGFYESIGFESCDKGKLVSFVRSDNINNPNL